MVQSNGNRKEQLNYFIEHNKVYTLFQNNANNKIATRINITTITGEASQEITRIHKITHASR